MGLNHDVTEIDVEMVEDVPWTPSPPAGPDTRQDAPRDLRVPLDLLARVEQLVADPVDVGRGPPHVWRGVSRELVCRRAVATVRGDPDHPAHLVTQQLEVCREDGARARYVTWERPHLPCLPHVDVDQLPEAEIRSQLDLQRFLPARDPIVVCREATRDPVSV